MALFSRTKSFCQYLSHKSHQAGPLTIKQGFNLFHCTPLPLFEFLSANPSASARYSKAMGWFSSMPALSPQHIVASFPWSSLPSGSTIVDLGGGHGATSIALATAFPKLNFVVQDLPDVVAGGRASLPKDLTHRVQFQIHDIFTPQTSHISQSSQDSASTSTSTVAVYLLRWILHDWSDTHALRILRAIIPALQPGTRLCIAELILPPSSGGDSGGAHNNNGVSPYMERKVRGMDLAMLGFHNAKERDRGEWAALLRAADERFRIREIRRAEGSMLSCIEVVWGE